MTDLRKPFQQFCDLQNRRQFIKQAGIGLGAAAVSSMAQPASAAVPRGCHHEPKAKRVIFLFMAGAPSQLDLFDYKPQLEKLHGQPLPAEISKGQRVTAMTRGKKQVICASIFKFAQHGQSGLYMCELLPHLSTLADDICLIKSTHTDAINHDPAKTFFCTGAEMPGRASMGSWLSYGLGSNIIIAFSICFFLPNRFSKTAFISAREQNRVFLFSFFFPAIARACLPASTASRYIPLT